MYEKASILIVDDDESIRRSLSLILKRKGYTTELAGTGRETLEKAQKRFFNVVLLDIKLPDMEGIELLTFLKQIQPSTVIFIVTAYASLETTAQALKIGASAYFTKPLDMDEILDKLDKALGKRTNR
ncbi:response regulator [Candidatus Poribacteria bacterium]